MTQAGESPNPESSPGRGGGYLIVVQAPCTRISGQAFATESAFAEHLRTLRRKLAPRFDRLHIAAPTHAAGVYEANKHHLAVIDSPREGIEFTPMFPEDMRTIRYWLTRAGRNWRALRDLVHRCDVVHSGMSDDIWRPVCFMAILQAVRQGRTSLFHVDIDFRRDARLHYVTGDWSRKSYLLCRYIYDPLRLAQVRYAVRRCSLVVLKGRKMVQDYGNGLPHVRDFYDTAHSPEQVIEPARLERKLARMRDASRPLTMVYFGQLVWRKGVDSAIRAVHEAAQMTGRDFRMHIIGAGDRRESLRALVRELGAEERILFHEAVRYGPALFDKLYDCDVTLATPLTEDTPRSAFDALASGCPIVAFDLYYYRDLEASGAVIATPWSDVGALAQAITALDQDRARLEAMARAGVQFARDNTQETWLDRRIGWTMEALDRERGGRR